MVSLRVLKATQVKWKRSRLSILPEADVVESLVVDAEGLIGVLDQLVDGEGGVVGLDDGVRHLRTGHDAVGVHDAIGELFPHLRDQESAHARPGTTTQGMSQLEALQER